MSLVALFFASVLTQNIVLSKFLGMCPFFGVSKNKKGAIGMGLSVIIVVMISSLFTYLIYYGLLVPYKITYLKNIIFILSIAVFVQMLELIIKKYLRSLYYLMGIYLPLITTNCAVLGIILLNIDNQYTLPEVMIYALGSSIGFTLVIYIFSTIRERLEKAPIIKSFRGLPIAFITASIMALLFSRYL